MEPVGQDGAPHRQWHKLDSVKPSWYQEGSTHREYESEGKEEQMTEILLMKNELNVFR